MSAPTLLLLKLVLTPALIAAASLAARRWGQAVGGWLVGLPLTSAPIAFFLAIEHGSSFAADAAAGSLAGALAEAAFCVAYAGTARHAAWPAAFVVGSAAFAVVGAVTQRSTLSMPSLTALVCVALALSLAALPRRRARVSSATAPRWDLPARMASATVVVLAITGFAATLGPRLSGILATYPVYAATLTVFAHRESVAAAVQVLRGLLLGLFAFAAFFVALGSSIERVGITAAFALAAAAALLIQGASLMLVMRSGGQQNLQGGNSRE
jgi:hypothetical protein